MSKPRRKPKKADNERHVEELSRYLERKGPGDEWHAPTPERVAHAERLGEKITPTIIHNEQGFPTGSFYWRISPVLDDLKRRGSISAEEYEAAYRFLRHWHHGIHKGAPTSKLMPRYDGATGDLTPTERQWHYAGMAKKAFNGVDPLLQPALGWLIHCLGDALPLSKLGAYYAPDKGAQTQSSQGTMVLRLALIQLCAYYGIDHRLSKQRTDRLAEVILANLTLSASS